MSWYDAARFTNWLHNGQGSGSTETGAYTLNGATCGTDSQNDYGINDMAGNVWEWNDAIIGSSRGLRGGSWFGNSSGLAASSRLSGAPSLEDDLVGFRVASVPETSSVLLIFLAVAASLTRRRRDSL